MTPVDTPDLDEVGAAGLARIARVVGDRTDARRHAAGRERLLLALTKRSSPSTPRQLLLLVAALALAVVVAIVVERRPVLEYRTTGAVVADGPWLAVPPSGGALSVRFSDGTEVDLGPGSKGRVAGVTRDGARVVLGAGVLHARVVHRPQSRWTVLAGPYTIEVTGTAFEVGWSDASEQLELSLHDGSVLVRGPSLPDGLRVAAGQRLVARARTGEAQLSSLLADLPHADAPAADMGARTPEEQTQVRSTPRPLPSWSEMLADGNFRGVLDAAEARGIDATLSHASLVDVVALADAARYLHERAIARRGLLAQRSRFAGSAEARSAAFVLGRMADDGGSREEAIGWYNAYLAESMTGPFVAEALGRKLVALVELGDVAGARAVAREYLRRFPQGAHAIYARDHAQGP